MSNDEYFGDLFSKNGGDSIKGMVFSHPHETEIEAAVSVREIRLRLQREIVQAFTEHGAMTDEELEQLSQFVHYGQTTVSKRRTELYQKGIIVWTGRKRPNSRGHNMKEWNLAK